MTEFYIDFDHNEKERKNVELNFYQEENKIKEEEKILTHESSKIQIEISTQPLNLLNKKRREDPSDKIITTYRNKKMKLNKREDYLKLKNSETVLKNEEEDEENDKENMAIKNLEKSIRKNFKLDLKFFYQFDNKYYSEMIKGEENYMDATISRINEFSNRKKFPQFYADREDDCNFTSLGNKKNTETFFFLSKNDNDDDKVCNYLKNVPYLCPFPSCKRKFFSLKNLEQHFH